MDSKKIISLIGGIIGIVFFVLGCMVYQSELTVHSFHTSLRFSTGFSTGKQVYC